MPATSPALSRALAHETIRPEKKPEHSNRLLHGLKRSVENFKTSRPELTAFATRYSDLGLLLSFELPGLFHVNLAYGEFAF
jgi:hypothetical protein